MTFSDSHSLGEITHLPLVKKLWGKALHQMSTKLNVKTREGWHSKESSCSSGLNELQDGSPANLKWELEASPEPSGVSLDRHTAREWDHFSKT